jgi:hypothetical protein
MYILNPVVKKVEDLGETMNRRYVRKPTNAL